MIVHQEQQWYTKVKTGSSFDSSLLSTTCPKIQYNSINLNVTHESNINEWQIYVWSGIGQSLGP
jgi:hypothetical protein